ncbi:filamentous hemagglutinin family N-terminal domain [Beggiatoa alba B18LD]|uniref:Filamentous hemagglutinin family N-terminal domain n=1 Tax=Beggiatoa alba B18LD TaxID=395493 RepID=I3CK10_9GAMM|nr:filamentous hemagglutinin N-terminal domain-containing protein [Beggiatoa alba]EIJ43953.1 filamentous hemagglutinin family N-terminal domain [Beggiatoa alba B18LD]
MQNYRILMLIGFLFSPLLQADIILDNTLGTDTTRLNSSIFNTPEHGDVSAILIQQEMGKQYGTNLFYSFSEFNLQSGDMAYFLTKPDSVTNIISRVTGGKPSFINGTISSNLVGGDLFFINPQGIIFGEGSSVEVFSSFHASTADTLYLGTDGEFNARYPEQSVLTSAPPSAYGFLTETPADIRLNDTFFIAYDNDISLIGGNIQIDDSFLWAVSKRIALISLASAAQVNFDKLEDLANLSSLQRGNISLDHSYLLVSGAKISASIQDSEININTQKAGDLYIYGGQFIVKDSVLMSGGVLDLSVENTDVNIINNDDSGNILMQINSLKLENSLIATLTNGTGKGGDVYIFASEQVDIGGKTEKDLLADTGVMTSQIAANSLSTAENAGQAGVIYIETPVLLLHDGGKLDSSSEGSGNAGGIFIKANDVEIRGSAQTEEQDITNPYSGLFVNSVDSSETGGDAGIVAIQADNLRLLDGGQISSSTFGGGNGGTILLTIKDTLILGNANIGNPLSDPKNLINVVKEDKANDNVGMVTPIDDSVTTQKDGMDKEGANEDLSRIPTTTSGILASSSNQTLSNSGEAGEILISAKTIDMNSGFITTTTLGTGNAGKIGITADNLYMHNGATISSPTEGTGNGGAIFINVADTLEMLGGELQHEFALPTAIQATSYNIEGTNGGQAGEIHLSAKNLIVDGALISGSTTTSGSGNFIEIQAEHIKISGTTILEDKMNHAGIYASSESHDETAGNAGEIVITTQTLDLEEGGSINASTQNAAGGNINLNISQQIYLRNGGNITTSVRGGTGNSGNITISAPQFVIVDKGQIVAQAMDGNGGNITLETEQLLASTTRETQIDASSQTGISGNIVITSPIVDISGNVISLPSGFFNATTQLQSKCGLQNGLLESRFVVRSLKTVGKTPQDLRSINTYTPNHISLQTVQKTDKLPDLNGQLFVQVQCKKRLA